MLDNESECLHHNKKIIKSNYPELQVTTDNDSSISTNKKIVTRFDILRKGYTRKESIMQYGVNDSINTTKELLLDGDESIKRMKHAQGKLSPTKNVGINAINGSSQIGDNSISMKDIEDNLNRGERYGNYA